jgi:hypothetical protein
MNGPGPRHTLTSRTSVGSYMEESRRDAVHGSLVGAVGGALKCFATAYRGLCPLGRSQTVL